MESLELLTRNPHRILKMDVTVYPRFLGNLLYICSALRPRSDNGTRSIKYPCTALASIKAKAPTRQFSRLNHTAFALAVYASHWKLLPTMQDSLPAVDQTLPGRSLPPGRPEEFHHQPPTEPCVSLSIYTARTSHSSAASQPQNDVESKCSSRFPSWQKLSLS